MTVPLISPRPRPFTGSGVWCLDPWHNMDAVEALEQMRSEASTDYNTLSQTMPRGMVNEITTFDPSSRIAVIDFSGVAGWNLPRWALDHGYTDLALLVSGLEALVPLKPAAVLLHIDTPGGIYNGTPEAAARIAEFAHFTAPVHAFTDGRCLCLGMWLASACTSFMASPSATVGGIGAYSILEDSSAAWSMAGLKKHVFRSGPLKGMGEPGSEVTNYQVLSEQTRITEIGDSFKLHILNRWRGASLRILDGAAVQAQSTDGMTVHHGLQRTKNHHAQSILQKVLNP